MRAFEAPGRQRYASGRGMILIYSGLNKQAQGVVNTALGCHHFKQRIRCFVLPPPLRFQPLNDFFFDFFLAVICSSLLSDFLPLPPNFS